MIRVGNLTFKNAILCEEVRQEKNNKFILLGVFSGDILVEEIPANLGLSFYLEAIIAKPGPTNLWLKMSGPSEEDEALIEARMEAASAGTAATIALPRMDVLMRGEGVFRLSASQDEKDWVTLIEKKVSQRDGLWSLSPIERLPLFEQSPSDDQETSSQPEPSRRGSRAKRPRS